MAGETTRLLQIDRRRRIAFGVEWMTPPGVRDIKNERRQLARETKASHTVVLRHGKDRPVIGFAYGLPRRPLPYAAAALFALYVREGCAVFVCDLGKGRAGLVGVRDGLPVVGFDTVVTHDSARIKVSEFSSKVGQPVRIFGNVPVSDTLQDLSPETLLAQPNAVKVARLVTATLPIGLAVSAVAVTAAVAAGIYGWSYYQQRQAQLEQASRQKPVAADPNIAYRRMLPAAMAGAGLRAENVGELLAVARALPLTNHGWWLSKVLCQPGQCTTTWSIDGGTFDSFSETPLNGGKNIQMQSDFKTVIEDFPLQLKPESEGVTETHLLPRGLFQRRIGTMVQRLAAPRTNTAQLMSMTLTLGQLSVLALPANATESLIRNPVRFGTWTMQGKLWMASFPAQFPPGFTVDSLTIDIPLNDPEGANITIQGKYYVAS